ncbi:MAG: TIGR02996 domain-containing protein [Myxococcota bacterium]
MQDLYEAVRQDPDDLSALNVLADWLSERADPRGAFIHTQIQLEDPDLPAERRAELKAQEAALLAEHQRAWLGDLAALLLDTPRAWDAPQWQFRRGFLHTLDLRDITTERVEALAAAEERVFVRSFAVAFCWGDEDALDRLFDLTLPNVRRLTYGDGTGSLPEEGRAATLASGMPRLEEIAVSGRSVETRGLFRQAMPALRELTVSCARHYAVATLAGNASLGQLQSIEFVPHARELDDDDRGYLTGEHVRMLARSPHLTALKRLHLQGCTAGDAGCRELVASGLLRRLEVLELPYGEVTDDGARALADGLGALKRIDLSGNSLTEAGVAALKATGVALQAGNQEQWRPHRGYLAYGDCE